MESSLRISAKIRTSLNQNDSDQAVNLKTQFRAKTDNSASSDAVKIRISDSHKTKQDSDKIKDAYRAPKGPRPVPTPAPVEPQPGKSDGTINVKGTYDAKHDAALFGGFALQFGKSIDDKGGREIRAYVLDPKGKGVINGTGAIDKDGNVQVTLENGDTYSGQLSVDKDAGTAALNNVQYLGNKKPQPAPVKPTPIDAAPVKPVAPDQGFVAEGLYRDGIVAFDGVTLDFNKKGRVDVAINLGDKGTLRGTGRQREDGSYEVELENGQVYSFRMEFDEKNGKARLSNLALEKPRAPVGSVNDEAKPLDVVV